MTIHIISFMNCTLILNSNNDHLEKSFCLIISVAMNASSIILIYLILKAHTRVALKSIKIPWCTMHESPFIPKK